MKAGRSSEFVGIAALHFFDCALKPTQEFFFLLWQRQKWQMLANSTAQFPLSGSHASDDIRFTSAFFRSPLVDACQLLDNFRRWLVCHFRRTFCQRGRRLVDLLFWLWDECLSFRRHRCLDSGLLSHSHFSLSRKQWPCRFSSFRRCEMDRRRVLMFRQLSRLMFRRLSHGWWNVPGTSRPQLMQQDCSYSHNYWVTGSCFRYPVNSHSRNDNCQ